MAWRVDAAPGAFERAVAWFLSKRSMPKAAWRKLTQRERRRAFTIAQVARTDTIVDVWKAVDSALAKGDSLEQFKRATSAKLRKAWGEDGVGNPGWRMETVFRTNVQSAYGAARWEEMTDPDVTKLRPYAMYDAILDSRTTSLCESLNGAVLPVAEWKKRGLVPPAHFNCRAGLRSLRESQAKKRPGFDRKLDPNLKAADGFGLAAEPGEWEPDLADYPPELRRELERRLGGAPAEPAEPAADPTPKPRAPELRFVGKYTEEYFASHGITVPGDLTEDAQHVFGSKKLPAIESLEEIWSGPEHRIKLKHVYVHPDSASFSGDIIDPKDGSYLGQIDRSFRRRPDGTLEAHHGLFRFELEEDMGKGGGAAMLWQSIQAYKQLGVKEITVDAAWIGRYAWATFGYDWARTSEETRMRSLFTEFLVSHGLPLDFAKETAKKAAKHPWTLAATDLDGIKVDAQVDNSYSTVLMQGLKLGKAFFLTHGMWSGKLSLDQRSASYKRAKKRVGS